LFLAIVLWARNKTETSQAGYVHPTGASNGVKSLRSHGPAMDFDDSSVVDFTLINIVKYVVRDLVKYVGKYVVKYLVESVMLLPAIVHKLWKINCWITKHLPEFSSKFSMQNMQPWQQHGSHRRSNFYRLQSSQQPRHRFHSNLTLDLRRPERLRCIGQTLCFFCAEQKTFMGISWA